MMHALRLPARLLTLLAPLLLGACSVLPEPSRYQLYRLPPSNLDAQPITSPMASLQLDAPRADDLTASNRVVVLREGHQLSAWSGMRWASPAPALWRDQMLDAFHNADVFRVLSIGEDNLDADVRLTGHLRAFHVDQTGTPPRAVIRFDAQLIDRRERRVNAMHRFDVEVPLNSNTPAGIAQAMGNATDRMARQLLGWIDREG